MAQFMPFIVILLALIAAFSIALIAWELSDHKFHESFEQEKRHERPGHPPSAGEPAPSEESRPEV